MVNWPLVAGLSVTVFLGFGVGTLVRAVGRTLPMEAPSSEIESEWDKLRKMKTGGFWIGQIERLIFFAALWIPSGWPILTSWLVYKLAYYWQGVNFWAFPAEPPNKQQAAYLVAKRQLGNNHVTTALVGLGLNIVLALLGVATGRSL